MAGWARSGKIKVYDEIITTDSFKKSYPSIIRSFLQKKITYVMLRVTGKGYEKVNINEIIFLKGTGYNTFVYTTFNKIFKVRLSQKHFKSLFPNDIIQVHKSYSINKNHSLNISGNDIVLRNGYRIPVNNTYNIATV
jgi:DNA-binding LytR/AlgR family response regulator